MADRDRDPDTSIIGRDTDAANGAHGRDVRLSSIADDAEDQCEDLDIIFEFEKPETTH